jgi:hypothetical protein
MVTIPLYSFLIIYFVFLIIFAVFSIVNISHLIDTGTLTFVSFLMTLVVAAMTVLTLYATWYFLRGVNWQEPITIWNSEWFGNLTIFN